MSNDVERESAPIYKDTIPNPDQFRALVENAGHAVTFLENVLCKWSERETARLDLEKLIPEATGLIRMVLRVTLESHDDVVKALNERIVGLEKDRNHAEDNPQE
jgi:hypothetical protein